MLEFICVLFLKPWRGQGKGGKKYVAKGNNTVPMRILEARVEC